MAHTGERAVRDRPGPRPAVMPLTGLHMQNSTMNTIVAAGMEVAGHLLAALLIEGDLGRAVVGVLLTVALQLAANRLLRPPMT